MDVVYMCEGCTELHDLEELIVKFPLRCPDCGKVLFRIIEKKN